jgi:hypothetical protein
MGVVDRKDSYIITLTILQIRNVRVPMRLFVLNITLHFKHTCRGT